jgi:hypothetical protein
MKKLHVMLKNKHGLTAQTHVLLYRSVKNVMHYWLLQTGWATVM